MSWIDVEPIVRTVPNAKASLIINADGIARINISFSDPFYRSMGEPTKCHVQAGTGDKLGMVRIVPGKGKFEINALGKGGGRMQIRAPDGIAPRVRESETCPSVDKDGADAYVITLPIAAWASQVAAPSADRPLPRKDPSAAPQRPASTDPIDAVAYLTSKGLKITRLATPGKFTVAGQQQTKADVLTQINRYRRNSELPVVGLDDVW